MSTRNGKHATDGEAQSGFGVMVPIKKIWPCPLNPRKTFDPDELAGLTQSVRDRGVEVPVLLRPAPGFANSYELIDGERRFRAAVDAGLKTIPALVKHYTDAEVLEAQLVVDVQRANINDVERAAGLQRLITEYGWSLEDAAASIGRSADTVRHMLLLARLDGVGRQGVIDGVIPRSTAMAIARIPGAAARDRVARIVLVGNERHGQHEPPTDEDLARARREGRDPLTYRQTRQIIADRCYRELKRAPFSTKSLDLVPGAGSCGGCPKRGGNLRDDPEYAGVRGDICTDPECYAAKLQAHAERIVEAHKTTGRPVVSGQEAAALFDRFTPTRLQDGRWVDLGTVSWEDPKKRPYEKLLAKPLADQITVAVDPTGTPHRLVPRDAANQELRKRGIRIPGDRTGENRSFSSQRKEDARKHAAAKVAARAANALVASRLRATAGLVAGFPPALAELLRALIRQMAEAVWTQACRAVMLRRRANKGAAKDARDAVRDLADACHGPELVGLLGELVAARVSLGWSGHSRAVSTEEKAFWAAFGVDVEACRKEAEKASEARAKKGKKKRLSGAA